VRGVLILLAGCFLLAAAVAGQEADATVSMSQQMSSGEHFLSGLFDRQLELLPEYDGAKIYWLYHDNYLAAKLLKEADPELSRRIAAAMRGFGVSHSGKIELLFDEAPKAFPFRMYELVDVTNLFGKRIRTERVTEKLLEKWDAYADLLLMAAIAKAKTEPEQARDYFQQANALWDGHGFADPASRKSGLYATYKLALSLLAADRIGKNASFAPEARKLLRNLQAPTGGWITDYDLEGKPRGLANVETTCLVLMALRIETHRALH
jgi:hypothetical protein